MTIGAKDISDEDVEAVEEEVGMGCGAWDCVNPKEIVAASLKIMAAKLNLDLK